MSRLVNERAALLEADRHLRTAVYLIAAQERRVEQHRAAGLQTIQSEELLRTMNAILRTFIAHRQQILSAIAFEEAQWPLRQHMKTNGRLCAPITLRPARIPA